MNRSLVFLGAINIFIIAGGDQIPSAIMNAGNIAFVATVDENGVINLIFGFLC